MTAVVDRGKTQNSGVRTATGRPPHTGASESMSHADRGARGKDALMLTPLESNAEYERTSRGPPSQS